jgi:hypothetical protein
MSSSVFCLACVHEESITTTCGDYSSLPSTWPCRACMLSLCLNVSVGQGLQPAAKQLEHFNVLMQTLKGKLLTDVLCRAQLLGNPDTALWLRCFFRLIETSESQGIWHFCSSLPRA